MDEASLSGFMEWRLSLLQLHLHDKRLSARTRQTTLDHLVRVILKELDNEPAEARPAVLDHLTLLGFGYLIKEQP